MNGGSNPQTHISTMEIKPLDMEIKSITPLNNFTHSRRLDGISSRAHNVLQYYASKRINVA